jgi:hypothetical protein
MGRRLPSALAAVALVGALSACEHENQPRDVVEPESSYSLVPVPPRPMTGTLDAVLRQSSRDAARGRMQVWIFNGTDADVEPTGIAYEDPRLSRSIVGQRVRTIPSGLERGFPLPLPGPTCDGYSNNAPTLTVRTTEGTALLGVADDLGIVQRYVDAVCFELAVERVVELEWDDTVPSTDDVGTLTLVATPTGRPGRVEILKVGGTPVLKAAPNRPWRPRVSISGTGPPQRIELAVVPARCDSHAFFEAGGATAFRLRLRLDGEESEYVLRMSQSGAQAAIAYAIDACGLAD